MKRARRAALEPVRRLALPPRLWQKPDAFGGDAPRCCSSSVVEHSLGKGEVESSILSCSTIFPFNIKSMGTEHSLFPSERNMKLPKGIGLDLGETGEFVRLSFARATASSRPVHAHAEFTRKPVPGADGAPAHAIAVAPRPVLPMGPPSSRVGLSGNGSV